MVWLSSAVVKISDLRVGIVVLRSISFVKMPPFVSTPSDSGVTSSSRMSFTSPFRTPAWIAAPTATTSSGFTPLCGSLPPVSFFTSSWIMGIRVEPPTRITWSIAAASLPQSLTACSNGVLQRSTRSSVIRSNSARVSFISRCSGPSAVAVMNGRLMVVSATCDSSILAFSAASFSRCSAIRSFDRSTPWSFLNSSPASR